MPARTIPNLFEDSVKKFSENILMWEKTGDKYEAITYEKMQEKVYQFAAGLQSLSLKRGDRAALISEGRSEWVISELGILYSGAVNVPISVKIDELSDLKFRLAHSGCRMVIVSRNQLDKIRGIKKDLPDLEKTILLDRMDFIDENEITFFNILELGRKYLVEKEEEFESVWSSIQENDYANICYTSGTTADPKGTILTHRNYTSNVEQSTSLLPIPEYYLSLLILPWDHSFSHTVGIYTLMKNGASMASVQNGKTPIETLKNLPLNIREIKPTFLLSVPAVAKNFKKNIEKGIREKGPTLEKIFKSALKIAYYYNAEGWNRGKGLRIFVKPVYAFFDLLIFSKIRKSFGGRLEFFIGGGALLDIELQRFFYAIGIPMFQGYGLTEASPVISSNVPKKHKLGSSGFLVKDLEVKICDENRNSLPAGEKGEIVVRGENVMAGYWKNEKATREVLNEGWLYTGDMGYIDKDGFLYVLGRFKSLLIGSDGEKYSPESIEEAIIDNSPFIDQILLYNNQNPYTVALLVPNKDSVLLWLKDKGLSYREKEGQTAALMLLDSEIGKFRSGGRHQGMFPSRWLPVAVALLDEGFNEQNHFLNSTLKMVRGKIIEFYRNRIEYLYTPEAKDICNPKNSTIISRLD